MKRDVGLRDDGFAAVQSALDIEGGAVIPADDDLPQMEPAFEIFAA